MGYTSSSRRPSKRLGQNFLVDKTIASEIVSTANLTQADTVLEPGSGYGTLTRLIQRKAGKVLAVEKDPELADKLRETFSEYPNVIVVSGDVLKAPLLPFNKVVGTPPYYLSSRLVLFLIGRKFDLASLVLQKEFGERLVAEPGSREYGRLTVAAQRNLNVEKIREIPRTVFHPRPKVDSVLLKFTPKEKRSGLDEALFEEMLRGIFTQRRRVLRGSLLHFLTLKLGRQTASSVIHRISVPDARVYQLSIDQLEQLCLDLARAMEGTPS